MKRKVNLRISTSKNKSNGVSHKRLLEVKPCSNAKCFSTKRDKTEPMLSPSKKKKGNNIIKKLIPRFLLNSSPKTPRSKHENDMKKRKISLTYYLDPIQNQIVLDRTSVIGSGSYGVIYKGTMKYSRRGPQPLTRSVSSPTKRNMRRNRHSPENTCHMNNQKARKYSFSSPVSDFSPFSPTDPLDGEKTIPVAIKEITLTRGSEELEKTRFEEFENEVCLLCLLSECEQIVHCYGWYQMMGKYYLVMEYCELGDLRSFLREKRKEGVQMSLTLKLNILFQIGKGLRFLHQQGMVHRDLKPSNILVTIKRNRLLLKICDFGTSKRTQEFSGTFCGTCEYLSPEQIDHYVMKREHCLNDWFQLSQNDIQRIDVYAYGITMWSVLRNGEEPYRHLRHQKNKKLNDFEMLERIHCCGDGENGVVRPRVSKEMRKRFPIDLIELMEYCWSENPNDRPRDFDIILFELQQINEDLTNQKD